MVERVFALGTPIINFAVRLGQGGAAFINGDIDLIGPYALIYFDPDGGCRVLSEGQMEQDMREDADCRLIVDVPEEAAGVSGSRLFLVCTQLVSVEDVLAELRSERPSVWRRPRFASVG